MFKDADLVILNKDSKYYEKKGLYKGMVGMIECDRVVDGRWLVCFFFGDMIEVDGKWYSQDKECDVKDEDMDLVGDMICEKCGDKLLYTANDNEYGFLCEKCGYKDMHPYPGKRKNG